VVYDTDTNVDSLDNHSNREEIKDARESKIGSITRKSDSFDKSMYYVAILQQNSDVLRVSCESSSFLKTILDLLPYTLLILALSLILLIDINRRQIRQILDPIETIANELDDNIVNDKESKLLEQPVYDELIPFINIIRRKNDTIKKYVDELEERSTTIKTITDNMREGLILLDKNMNVLSVNKSAEFLFGANDSKYEGRPFISLNRDLKIHSAIKNVISTKTAHHINIEMQGILLSMYIAPVLDEDTINGVLLFLVDESDKIKAEKRRREFSANVSHELKSPLTSINGYAEMIENNMVSPENVSKFATIIHQEGLRLLELIDNIIKLSKLDESEDNIEKSLFNPEKIIDEIVTSNQNKLDNKKIELVTDLQENCMIYGNENLIKEMIENLVTNAIKYNKISGKIKISIFKENDKTKIICEDTGIGIAEKYQTRVFERFFVVDKSRSSQESTGLGLSIIKHIVDIHNGSITLESKLDVGTKITITI
ncbi:MAG: ATP-binding protein, partial [Finegoldia magna]